MIAKKDPKLNFERKRFAFFQIGLIAAGTMMLAAFNWATPDEMAENREQSPKIMNDFVYEIVERPELEIPEPQVTENEPTLSLLTDEVDEVDELIDDLGYVEPFIDPLDIKISSKTNLPPKEKVGSDENFELVEDMPEFIGGDEAMMAYFQRTVKYPEISAKMGDQGRVYVKFLVNKDGAISNTHVVRGVTTELDNEAIRVVKNMPKWKPGKQRGREVNVWYVVPINFTLK